MSEGAPAEPPAEDLRREAAHREANLALGNALKLGLSMLGTLAVAVGIRFWLPRVAGPVDFGRLQFAEAFAITAFLFTSLGVDTYIGREVSTRPGHAGEFLGGLLVVRLIGSAVLLLAMFPVLTWLGKDAFDVRLVYIFAAGQILFIHNQTLGSLATTAGIVNELSIVNVVSKLVWGGGVLIPVTLGASLETVAIAFATAELVKLVVLHRVVHRRMGVQLQIAWRSAWQVLVVGLPYFANFLAHSLYAKIDVTMISSILDDAEVGYYAAAANVGTLALLFLPVVMSTALPMAMRVAAISPDEADALMRRASRIVLAAGALPALLLVLYANEVVLLLFGAPFAPSIRTLQVLAPMFPITYVSVVASMHLIQHGRVWILALVTGAGLLLNVGLNSLLIERAHAHFGIGGGGMAAAASSLSTETLVTALILVTLGRKGTDAAFIGVVLRVLLAGGLATGAYFLVRGFGLWASPVPALVYLGVAGATGALPLRALANTVIARVRRRAAPPLDSDGA